MYTTRLQTQTFVTKVFHCFNKKETVEYIFTVFSVLFFKIIYTRNPLKSFNTGKNPLGDRLEQANMSTEPKTFPQKMIYCIGLEKRSGLGIYSKHQSCGEVYMLYVQCIITSASCQSLPVSLAFASSSPCFILRTNLYELSLPQFIIQTVYDMNNVNNKQSPVVFPLFEAGFALVDKMYLPFSVKTKKMF